MRPDRLKERLTTHINRLTSTQATAKMVDLINLYHSIPHRHGSESDKEEAKALIKKEVSKLKSRVGTTLSKKCFWYLGDKDAWNQAKDGYLN